MAKPGPKPKNAITKRARGTHQKCRDKGNVVSLDTIAPSAQAPDAPADFIDLENHWPAEKFAIAHDVFYDLLGRLHSEGILQHKHIYGLADLAKLKAHCDWQWRNGQAPTGSEISNLRALYASYGVTPDAQLGGKGPQKPQGKFSNNGHGNRAR